jgi:adenylate cyclase class 2
MREIEIKLKVKDLDELEKKMSEAGCVFGKSFKQHDVIYSRVDDLKEFCDSYEGHVAVRIRREGDKTKLTVKLQCSNEMDNIEHEIHVENFDTTDEILKTLGWKRQVEVKKIRKSGKLGKYEVCLDKVDHLGDFIELEKMTENDDDPKKVRQELFNKLKPFDFSEKDEVAEGYDTLIYKLKNNIN